MQVGSARSPYVFALVFLAAWILFVGGSLYVDARDRIEMSKHTGVTVGRITELIPAPHGASRFTVDVDGNARSGTGRPPLGAQVGSEVSVYYDTTNPRQVMLEHPRERLKFLLCIWIMASALAAVGLLWRARFIETRLRA